MEKLHSLFEKTFGEKPHTCKPLTAAGSDRQYFRLQSENACAVGVTGSSVEENYAFEKIAKHLYSKGLSVPEWYAKSDDGLCYLQEDLGDMSLFEFIVEGRRQGSFLTQEKEMLHKTIAQLPEIQYKGAEGFDFSVCYPQSTFDHRAVMWDLNYFKYCFLKLQHIDFQENKLENDFEKFAKILLETRSKGETRHVSTKTAFLYRDFQSRNVMLKNGKPYFIDFQGARQGAVYYDLVSFLWQASANFPSALKEELTQTYLYNLRQFVEFDEQEFRINLNNYALFRTLQVLGAYGFRGLMGKKQHFINSIPFALKNLQEILRKINRKDIPYLVEILNKIEVENFFGRTKPAKVENFEPLRVHIFSFSYKKGIPVDVSGNGGGFVFDCRAVHNPGKYVEYQQLTGKDQKVVDFLEKDGEIFSFLEHCLILAEKSVERYLQRGFTDLQISFGCTGGQHRSVYSAQKTAEYLHQKYKIEVQLTHRELNLAQHFAKI